MRKVHFAVWIIALAFAALPAIALDRVIDSGIDLWRTAGDGTTFADFSKSPIPAGFFCHKSEPFTGRIVYRGVPVATGEPGVLKATDTIVHRLDNAVFNKRGVAVTRIQVRALEFESVAPVKTACGDFNVKVTLNGQQPVTRMRIVRENEKGGRYLAPIAVNLKVVFTPVAGGSSEPLELYQNFRFPALPNARWASRPGTTAIDHPGFVLTDTDSDRVPDSYLPGTSNFVAGLSLEKMVTYTCHVHPEGNHCVLVDQPAALE